MNGQEPSSIRARLDLRRLPPPPPKGGCSVIEVPAELHVLKAANGDPLLMFGQADGVLMIWPTPLISRHKFAFARYCRANVWRLRGLRVFYNHPLNERTRAWALWLGVDLEQGVIRA